MNCNPELEKKLNMINCNNYFNLYDKSLTIIVIMVHFKMKTLLKYNHLIAKLLPRNVDVHLFVLDQSWILFKEPAGGVY